MEQPTEKQLDKALENAFRRSQQFCDWFLSNTKFAAQPARYFWSRSDHPWGRIPVPVTDSDSGGTGLTISESETDVLVVFEANSGSRFALHIENKLANGHFTSNQSELYVHRAKHWLGDAKYQSYTDFETVLVAPKVFFERNRDDAQKFDRFVSHEEIAKHVPLFSQSCGDGT